MVSIIIPYRFKKILEYDADLNAAVLHASNTVKDIFFQHQLFFFEEYTDHSIVHLNAILEFSADLITEESFHILERSPKSVALYIFAVLLHDLGMQISVEGLFFLITNRTSVNVPELDNKTWKQLWEDFLDKSYRYNDKEKINIFGDVNWEFKIPNIQNRDKLDGQDKKLIGEFIRLYHPRIAHEIALNGFPVKDGVITVLEKIPNVFMDLSGIIARSHGMEVRDTFQYLEDKFSQTWARPYNTELVYLMILLRVSDYCQIDSARINSKIYQTRSFYSPVSLTEHLKHDDLPYMQTSMKDPETLVFQCTPRNSTIYLKLKSLLSTLQNELDRSWAILGEIYGKEKRVDQPAICFRRVKSNIDDIEKFSKGLRYIPERVKFTISDDLSKLLIRPLYGRDPTFGIRELLQNAVDACRQRAHLEKKVYEGKIKISFYKKEQQSYFKIEDNGIGMQLDTIRNYYLNVGASFRDSAIFRHQFVDNNLKIAIQRTGRFGIGVLAAFLLGETISLQTKAMDNEVGYRFEAGLTDEQIEITKIESIATGTTIVIPITDYVLENLVDSAFRFDKWFVQTIPEIIFEDHLGVFGELGYRKKAPSIGETLPRGWYQLPQTHYNRILWSFDGPNHYDHVDPVYTREENLFIAINGILLTGVPRFLNTRSFCMTIDDYDGRFPMNLNRNGLNEFMPFTKEVIRDIQEEFLSRLLIANVRNPYDSKGGSAFHNEHINHHLKGPIRIIYGEEGFIIPENYFLSRNKEKPYLIISTVKDFVDVRNGFSPKGAFFEVTDSDYSNWIETESYRLIVPESQLARFGSSKSSLQYSRLTNAFAEARERWAGENGIGKVKGTDLVVIANGDLASDFSIIELMSITKRLRFLFESKIEFCHASGYQTASWAIDSNHLLDEVLEYYLEGQRFIPYDFVRRRDVFKKAFNELGRFI